VTRPIDIATRHTVAFVEAHLSVPCHIVEVGCGNGEVATKLQSSGYRVTALDADPDAIGAARGIGVDAVEATWPDFRADDPDAILFTRSLHHIHDLDAAVAGADEQLSSGGVVLVEDFDRHKIDQHTAEWFAAEVTTDPMRRLLGADATRMIGYMLDGMDPLAAWSAHHDHELHSVESMAATLSRSFVVETEPVAYLYRYLITQMPPTDAAAEAVAEIFRKESELITSGRITPIGTRMVARRP